MNNTSLDRITSLDITLVDFFYALSNGNAGAMQVLLEWFNSSPSAVVEMLVLDNKRLYDHHIWELYRLCGKDIERFKYHVSVELPNQETGVLSVTGPFAPDSDDKEFWVKRSFGRPGSFWALESPPTEMNYVYPIE